MIEFRMFIVVTMSTTLEFITVDLEGVVDAVVIRCDSIILISIVMLYKNELLS